MGMMGVGFEDLLKHVPVGDLAARFNVDEDTVLEAVSKAVPGLVGGMAVNASTDEGAASLERATSQHTVPAAALAEVAETDGKEIVRKVLGDEENTVAHALGSTTQNSAVADLIPKLLLLLAALARQVDAGQRGMGSTATTEPSPGGRLIDILGGLAGSPSARADGLGDVLGGILGGGAGSAGGGLGGLLGGLVGKR